MAIFNIELTRVQTYNMVVEAKDEDEAIAVADNAIFYVDDYYIEDDGWNISSQEFDNSEISKKEIELSVKEGRFIDAEDFFD